MSQNEPAAEESIEKRTRRALEEPLSVVDVDGTPLSGDESLVRVISHSGDEYRVDVREGRCTCPDHEYRSAECKHIRRARFALGREPLDTATLAACEVDRNFADHVATDPQVVATDGGVIERPESGHERTRVPCSGGVLVFESRELGKELVGFEQVTEWDGVRSALVARGHDVGAIHHLPVFDKSDDVDEREEPVRSEPADFGHGESTGVQTL